MLLFSARRPALRWLGAASVAGSSLFGFGLALVLLVLSDVLYNQAYNGFLRKELAYARVLDAFMLRESAEQKLAAALAATDGVDGIRAEPVRDPGQLEFREQRSRVLQITELLPEASDDSMRKRILATSLVFRDLVESDRRYFKPVLEHARKAGAPEVEHIGSFYDWLAANIGEDGWDPVPLYEVRAIPMED
jgi:hypothetical protein